MQLALFAEGYYKPARLIINQAWAEETASRSSASQQRRQQAFERFTQREPSGFELMSEPSSTAISDSQSSARGVSQRGGRGERVEGVPEVIDECFSDVLDGYECFLHRF